MRKALTITLVAALALFAGSAAYANYCARDVVPASTLLVPYAVQDMSAQYTADGSAYTTILTVTNVSKDAQIIHITVWNAVSDACLDFNEVLSGYDVWQIFFRDMINGDFGNFDTSRSSTAAPNTGNRVPFEWGPDGRSTTNPAATALPVPNTTGTVGTSTNCFMPYGNGLILTSNIDCLRAPLFSRSHAGCGNLKVRADYNNDWLSGIGSSSTVTPIWYYVTVDVVFDCNFDFPNTLNFFTSATGYKRANVLIGDLVYLSAANNYSEAINAVHIESDIDGGNFPGGDTVHFYDPKANPAGSNAFLEPLATAVAFNYYDHPDGAPITTNVWLWKNYQDFFSTNNKVDDCGYYMYYNWDQDEHTNSRSGSCRVSPCNPNDIDPNEFPFETQSVPLTRANFDLVDTKGWMLIIFPPSYGPTLVEGGVGDPTTSPSMLHGSVDAARMMLWAGTKIVYGSYSAALEAATMANAHCFTGQVLPQLGVAWDYDPPTE